VKNIDVRTRTLHLVDIENLLGGPQATAGEVDRAFEQYLALAAWQPGDIVNVAANPNLALEFIWNPPVECSMHTAHGTDGADIALLAHAAPEFVQRRAGRLVIGSGDHAFIPRALAARALGVGVLVVARPDGICRGWYAHGFPVLVTEEPMAELAA
jgi:hypothetical protein